MSDNNFGGKYTTKEAEWRKFDQLPASIREVFAAAPYPYFIEPGDVNLCREGRLDAQVWRRKLINFICADIMASAAKAYGPDHPDAEISRLSRRRRPRT